MADTQKVRLVHPETGAEQNVHPDAVAGWQACGWRKPGTTTKSAAAVAKPKEKSNG